MSRNVQVVALSACVPSLASQLGMFAALADEAFSSWKNGCSGSAAMLLRRIGEHRRCGATLPSCAKDVLGLALEKRRRLLLHALLNLRINRLTRNALHYLNYDERRHQTNELWDWAAGFSRFVLAPRDELQVILDTAVLLGQDLTAGGDLQICHAFTSVWTRVIQLDQVLLQSRACAELSVRFFQAPLFVAEEYDLSFYWWFGPERRICASRITKNWLQTAGLCKSEVIEGRAGD